MRSYKDFVEKQDINYTLLKNKNLVLSSEFLNLYENPKLKLNSLKSKKISYYTEEPTEYIQYLNTNLPTFMQTNLPKIIKTNLPTFMQTNLPKIIKTNCPSINSAKNIKNITENKNLILNYVFIIFYSSISFILFLLMIFVCKYKYLKYKKNLKKIEEKKLDLDFGITYIDDF